MAKPAWGKKRSCSSCSALFYDMKKNPAVCPKCGTEDDLQPLLKPRRTPAQSAPKPALVPKPSNDDEEIPDDEDSIDLDDDEDDDLIVDDDDDDMDDDDVGDVAGGMDDDDKE